jgi:hypothetical protein
MTKNRNVEKGIRHEEVISYNLQSVLTLILFSFSFFPMTNDCYVMVHSLNIYE